MTCLVVRTKQRRRPVRYTPLTTGTDADNGSGPGSRDPQNQSITFALQTGCFESLSFHACVLFNDTVNIVMPSFCGAMLTTSLGAVTDDSWVQVGFKTGAVCKGIK